ncbi:hypothetical protein DHEL01_v212757 [Diaporthe helianthi]|uniref:Uncharacterized protein n=1 Tax=Diaporthe helianthi TaxID=158607 RepID=A0A2P5HF29_DIAHE|nr:hypothetical protein DHEL01_v212757 [Diaporthe helianthi]
MNKWTKDPDINRDSVPQLEHDSNLTDGRLICDFPGSIAAKMLAIQDGIYSLHKYPGKSGLSPGPGSCARISCASKSSIWCCNDHDDVFELDSFSFIADGANNFNFNCIVDRTEDETPEVLIWTIGQIFFNKWNVVIRGDEDDC